MTLDNNTEITEDPADESGSDESGVMKALRQQVKDQKKTIEAAPDRTELEKEIRATLKHETSIESQLVALGHPAGIRDLVAEKLGEKEVTEESVTEALTSIGYKVDTKSEGASEESSEADTTIALAEVSDLSSSVQSAAQNTPVDGTSDKIAAAKTPEELAAVMAEAELLH